MEWQERTVVDGVETVPWPVPPCFVAYDIGGDHDGVIVTAYNGEQWPDFACGTTYRVLAVCPAPPLPEGLQGRKDAWVKRMEAMNAPLDPERKGAR